MRGSGTSKTSEDTPVTTHSNNTFLLYSVCTL